MVIVPAPGFEENSALVVARHLDQTEDIAIMFQGRFHLEYAYRHMPGMQKASQCHLCLLVGLRNLRGRRESKTKRRAPMFRDGPPCSAQDVEAEVALSVSLAG